jgi:ankyrin repeat protein
MINDDQQTIDDLGELIKEAIDREDIEALSKLVSNIDNWADFKEAIEFQLDQKKYCYGGILNIPTLCATDPISYAAYKGSLQSLKYMVEAKNIDLIDLNLTSGISPLHWLSDNNPEQIIDYCLEKGMDINSLTGSPFSRFFTNEKVVILQDTPLIKAINKGYSKAPIALINAGADVNANDNENNPPIAHALSNACKEVVEALVKAGVNVNQYFKSSDNLDFHDVSLINMAVNIGQLEVVKILINAGANLESKYFHGTTPLCIASRNGNAEIVKSLIEAGANVNAESQLDNFFALPLERAAIANQIETVKTLIKAGAKHRYKSQVNNQSILDLLKAQEYIDDLLEGKKPAAIKLDKSAEEVVLARVENKLSKLLDSNKIAQNIGSIKSTLEGYKEEHSIADKVLAKIEEFIEDKVLESDVKVARSLGLSFPQSLKDIMEFANYQGDGTKELCDKLLKVYDVHKNEPKMIERLDEMRGFFDCYLLLKRSYIENHPEHNSSEIPSEELPHLNELFSDLLQLEGMSDYREEFNQAPLLEEAILFYCFYPEYQLPGSLTDIAH